MSSKRTQIREDVVERLKGAIAEVSNRVFSSRAEALGTLEVPCICVYTRDEGVETLNSNPTIQNRSLGLAIEILVKGTEAIDDELDDLAQKVETELLKASLQAPASGLYSSVALQRTDMGFVDQGRQPVGCARMVFDFKYETIFT